MNKKQLEKEVYGILDNQMLVKKDGSEYELEIYADYRDGFDPETVKKIFESTEPFDKFCEEIDEVYFEAEIYYMNELITNVKRALEKNHSETLEAEEKDFVEDLVRESVYVTYPEDHFLKQTFDVNVMLDTGDGNSDHVFNNWWPSYNAHENDPVEKTSSLLWFLRQQGCTLNNYRKALKRQLSAKCFLGSVVQEVINLTSHMNAVTFLVRMTLEEIIKLSELMNLQTAKYDNRENPDCGTIVLSKETTCGLFDCWNGGGSLFELVPVKDIEIPIAFIGRVQIDGVCEKYRWDVGNVYGMSGSAWKESLKEIRDPETPPTKKEEAAA